MYIMYIVSHILKVYFCIFAYKINVIEKNILVIAHKLMGQPH